MYIPHVRAVVSRLCPPLSLSLCPRIKRQVRLQFTPYVSEFESEKLIWLQTSPNVSSKRFYSLNYGFTRFSTVFFVFFTFLLVEQLLCAETFGAYQFLTHMPWHVIIDGKGMFAMFGDFHHRRRPRQRWRWSPTTYLATITRSTITWPRRWQRWRRGRASWRRRSARSRITARRRSTPWIFPSVRPRIGFRRASPSATYVAARTSWYKPGISWQCHVVHHRAKSNVLARVCFCLLFNEMIHFDETTLVLIANNWF